MQAPSIQAAESLGISSVPNLRAVGGMTTRDGRLVRTGLLYRSGALDRVGDGDLLAFERLRIRRVYDLRGAVEREMAPDILLAGAGYVIGDVLADWSEGGPDRVFRWWTDPAAARRALGGGRAEALWTDQYRALVTLASARAAYGRLFRELARAENLPALVHCSGGKDRSGWAAAALLLLVGVGPDVVMTDYLRGGWRSEVGAAGLTRTLTERGGDPALWQPIFSARPAYLEAALDQVDRSFGSIEAYFGEGLGVDAATQDALRVAFVT